MAQELITPKIPDAFKGLLTASKIVQSSILERTEKKISLLEGRRGVVLYSRDRSPPTLNNEIDISSPNFIALSESYFIVRFRYTVKDSRAPGNAQNYANWICTTSPSFSFYKNMRVELNGTEVTQSSKVADMQIVQHIMSLMESSVAKLQICDSEVYGLQKLGPQMALKDIPLGDYQYGVKRKRGFAFSSNDDGVDFDDTADDYTVKRRPTVELTNTEAFSNTVLENVVRVQSGKYEYKMRPFAPFFNVDDAWLPPGTQVKLRFDLPQAQLSRYLIVSDKGGGANSATGVGDVTIELLQLDFVYPTYRMESAYVDQVRLAKELYFHTWCPRMVQKSITDDAGTLELLHNDYIPRKMVFFLTDVKMSDDPALTTANASNSHNRLAMIHAGLTQLRVTINDEAVFDSPLKFDWECSQNSDGTYYYDYNKCSYLRGYNQLLEFFGKNHDTDIPITANDYCNHFFMIPICLNLDRHVDNQKLRGNLSIDYQFTDVANSPVKAPSHGSTSIKANLLCWDQYLYIMNKERGIKWDVV